MLTEPVLGFLNFCVGNWGERSWFCAILNILREEKDLSDKLLQMGFLLVPLNIRFHTLNSVYSYVITLCEVWFCHLLIFRAEFEVSILLLTTMLVELDGHSNGA